MSRKVDMDSKLLKNNYMPIKPGKSKKVRNQNISEIMSSYSESGKIGTSTPSSPEKAAKQAAAIAYDAQRKSAKILTTSRKKARLKALK